MSDPTPGGIVSFWFPDSHVPTLDEHMRVWSSSGAKRVFAGIAGLGCHQPHNVMPGRASR